MIAKRFFIVSLAFFAWASAIQAQNVDEIINKHIAALGGMDKINGVKSLIIEGFTTRGRGDRVFEIDMTRYIKLPNKVMTESFIRDRSIVQAYDGQTAWATVPFGGDGGPEVVEGARAQGIMNQANFAGLLVDYKSNGAKVELVGKEELKGSEVYNLMVTDKDGNVTHVYLDAGTYLETQRVLKRKSPEGDERNVTTTFSNYKDVSGIMMAHKVSTQGAPGFMGRGGRGGRGGQGGGRGGQGGGRGGRGGGMNTVTWTKIQVNAEIDDKIFMMK